MRKIITSLITIILILTASGCSKKPIELTMDNYSQYLDVRGSAYLSDYNVMYGYYQSFSASATAEGASANYEYNNVKVKIKLSVTAIPGHKSHDEEYAETHEYILTINCNIGGSGSDGGKVKAEEFFQNWWGGSTIHDNSTDFSYEMSIIDVSGTVTKAN